ncbi:hypothetical protein ABT301_04385 [Streptomyces sp. NPDC000987]|uniref:hypothetical protein n=1 Tax=Streptomyces sp. NPDC000987 TaxID=3154374 RepID=UPI003316AC09
MSTPEQQPHTPPPAQTPGPIPALGPETPREVPGPETPREAAADSVPALPDYPPAISVSRWSRLSRGAVLVIGAGLGATVVGACWAGVALVGGGEAGAPAAGASRSRSATAGRAEGADGPFSTDGTLTVAGIGAGLDEELCSGTGGYSDIDFGTQVTVTDADGTLVAMGSLGLGEKTEQGCEFPFTIDDITPGSKFYTVEISHRGGLTQTEEELRAGGLAFTLGD